MKRLLPVILFFAALAFFASDLSAKPLSRIIRDVGLTPDDFAMLGAAGESLYGASPHRPGRVVSWSNPESKSHGTAKLVAVRDNCAYMQHFVFPGGAVKSKEIRIRRCRTADGKWVLQP